MERLQLAKAQPAIHTVIQRARTSLVHCLSRCDVALNHPYFRLCMYCVGDCSVSHRRDTSGENLYPLPRYSSLSSGSPSSFARVFWCVRSLCRLTFINYCRRRKRERYKSNCAVFVSLSCRVYERENVAFDSADFIRPAIRTSSRTISL